MIIDNKQVTSSLHNDKNKNKLCKVSVNNKIYVINPKLQHRNHSKKTKVNCFLKLSRPPPATTSSSFYFAPNMRFKSY